MTQHEIDSIVDDALNAAIASIQSAIGQTDGGFAALWFTGTRETVLKALLADYTRAEFQMTTDNG